VPGDSYYDGLLAEAASTETQNMHCESIVSGTDTWKFHTAQLILLLATKLYGITKEDNCISIQSYTI